jgi:hypothetical protein
MPRGIARRLAGKFHEPDWLRHEIFQPEAGGSCREGFMNLSIDRRRPSKTRFIRAAKASDSRRFSPAAFLWWWKSDLTDNPFCHKFML